ncbi:hypothetical protein [Mycobacterium riyadhense]|uniref:Transmembrane protein n=1 Tax=Mycobacterium riyadhense TaxID=486698 RepID=A0A1X2DHJ8_9MYCO|nr:hypothetical protein [Mycobacterium riyadhense]MCV7144912.1 hypothetical protein [Mycobacterium riyadhense]ORW87608.1 hypothetical protein AWC22_08215 [Mycobacterium riyadhense]VTP00529.1 hypothetical protein BIN_B_03582 [Mycobacterium riyadhense]
MADGDADKDRESSPGTEPFVPDFDDTGSQPLASLADLENAEKPHRSSTAATPAEDSDIGEAAAAEPAAPVVVPGRYLYLKWWKLVLVILGVWFAAAEVGLSLYYWWYHTIDKTPPVFVVLVYVVACAVGGLMLSMVQGRPLITALSIAVMSGPFASVAAAAPLYGYFFCERMSRCLIGILPY